MSIALVHFGCILQLMIGSAISLSVCRGVGSCLCPNPLSMLLLCTVLHTMIYNPTSSASVADDMTFLIMGAMLISTASLLGGRVMLLERKKCPSVLLLLQALGSLK